LHHVDLKGSLEGRFSACQRQLQADAPRHINVFRALAVCVVYRGIGIPVAWTIVPAGQKKAWRREWLRMLRLLRPAVP
jgi:hypothetical protein